MTGVWPADPRPPQQEAGTHPRAPGDPWVHRQREQGRRGLHRKGWQVVRMVWDWLLRIILAAWGVGLGGAEG